MILLMASAVEEREALVPLITAKGYPVTTVDCGDEVVPRLRFQCPKLVIVDCDAPAGFDALDLIRREAHAITVPVIMFSKGGEHLREKALGRGASAFVPKGTLDWADLLDEIHRFVGPPPK